MITLSNNVRYFNNFNEYEAYYKSHKYRDNITDIVKEEQWTCADATYKCKSVKTAIKRLAKATGWHWVLYELESDSHRNKLYADCDSVSIDIIDDELIYIAARQYK